MNITVFGAGLMGPAAAYNALTDPKVKKVTLIDQDEKMLDRATSRINAALDYRAEHERNGDDRTTLLRADHPARYPLETIRHDLTDHEGTVVLMNESDVILTALPWKATRPAVRAALEAGVPLVDLAIPDDDEMAELRKETEHTHGFILLGCGLEPGLTEIEVKRLAARFDQVEAFHIMVGGIPTEPSGPLGYRIVFGGDKLPLRDIPALILEDGSTDQLPRYSEVEQTWFEGVGEVEAWNEGVLPWILDQEEMKGVKKGRQKTIRWPGYAAKATMLNELGLLGTEPVDVNGTDIIPKDLVDTLLRPHVTMQPTDRDITLFRVDVRGRVGGVEKTYRTEMIDRFDSKTGFTSMARTTAFTGMILARMIADGTIRATGLRTPDELVTGEIYDRMIRELASEGVTFRTETL